MSRAGQNEENPYRSDFPPGQAETPVDAEVVVPTHSLIVFTSVFAPLATFRPLKIAADRIKLTANTLEVGHHVWVSTHDGYNACRTKVTEISANGIAKLERF